MKSLALFQLLGTYLFLYMVSKQRDPSVLKYQMVDDQAHCTQLTMWHYGNVEAGCAVISEFSKVHQRPDYTSDSRKMP